MSLSSIFRPGTVVVVTGKPQQGKTSLSLLLADLALKKHDKIEIISNVRLRKDPERYHYFWKTSQFLWYLSRVERGVFLTDEAGTFASSGANDIRLVRGQLQSFVKLAGHFGLSTIWIDQVWGGSVPPAIREMATYRFHCPSVGYVELYEVEGGECNLIMEWENDILPTIQYDKKGMATFDWDLPKGVDFSNLFEALSGMPSSKFGLEIVKWCNKNGLAPPRKEIFNGLYSKESSKEGEGGEVDTMDRWAGLDPGGEKIPEKVLIWGIHQRYQGQKIPSISRIAKFLNVSESTVSKYRSEYKKAVKGS